MSNTAGRHHDVGGWVRIKISNYTDSRGAHCIQVSGVGIIIIIIYWRLYYYYCCYTYYLHVSFPPLPHGYSSELSGVRKEQSKLMRARCGGRSRDGRERLERGVHARLSGDTVGGQLPRGYNNLSGP